MNQTTNRIIKLLVVEDSALQRELLMQILMSCPDFHILGIARNGVEAIESLKSLRPDVVLMDLHMPKMNGVEAIQHIMTTDPLPIVAMSASTGVDDIISGFHALEAGAVAFTDKPGSIQDPRYEVMCSSLIQTIKLMSEVKVIRRREKIKKLPQQSHEHVKQASDYSIAKDIQVIAIGVSTGGPLVLQTILSLLPADFPPILVVQHIVPGFIQGLAQWLAQGTHCHIQVATGNEIPERGHVYLAPDHHHMGLMNNGRIYLKPNSVHHELCPSVDFLFNSVANVVKDKAMGILLTGMGSDGAQQLKYMRDQGGITIVQDKESSLIYGMPGSAAKLGAAVYTLTPEQIAVTIASLSRGVK